MGLNLGGIAAAITPKMYAYVDASGGFTSGTLTIPLSGLQSTDIVEVRVSFSFSGSAARNITIGLNDGSSKTISLGATWGGYEGEFICYMKNGGQYLVFPSNIKTQDTQAITMASVSSCTIAPSTMTIYAVKVIVHSGAGSVA